MGFKENARKTAPFVAVGIATGVVGASLTFASVEKARAIGVPIVAEFAGGKPIKVDIVPRLSVTPEQAASMDLEHLRGAVLVGAGDSQGFPTDARVTNPDNSFTPFQPESMDAHAAAVLNEWFGLGVRAENYADVGLTSWKLLEQLQDKNSLLRKRLEGRLDESQKKLGLSPEDNLLLAVSIGPNDLQKVAGNAELIDDATAMGEGKSSRRSKIVEKTVEVVEAVRSVPTLLSLAKGQEQVGRSLEAILPEILNTIAEINQIRLTNHLPVLLGVVLVYPPDFGQAHAISVFDPVRKEKKTIVLNPVLQRFASMVAVHVARRLERGTKKFQAQFTEQPFPVIPASQEGVVFPKPEANETHDEHGVIDQHVRKGTKTIGENIAAAVAHAFKKPRSVSYPAIQQSEVA